MLGYVYDGYKRVTSFTVNGYAVRNYSYDSVPADAPYTGSPAGRLAKVDHLQGQGSVRFQEFYSYTQAGAVATKTLRYLRSDTGYFGDFTASYSWNSEGRMSGVQYQNIWNGSAYHASA